MKQLIKNPRIRDVLVLAPIPLLMLLLHPLTAWLLFAAIGFLGLYEYRLIVLKTRDRFYTLNTRIALASGIASMIAALIYTPLALLLVIAAAGVIYRREKSHVRRDLAIGQLVIPLVTVAAYWLRALDSEAVTGGGLAVFGLILVLAVVSDSAAYFVGRAMGKTPFAPVISPNKTWEGAIGGWVFGVIAGSIYLANVETPFRDLSLFMALLAMLLMVIVGQLGDLAESAFKRKYEVKDSGTILRSHGGILDRFDSISPMILIASFFVWIAVYG